MGPTWLVTRWFNGSGQNSLLWPCLFSCPEQLNSDLVTNSLTDWVSHFYFCHTKSNPRDLRPLRHLIRVMRRHDLTADFRRIFRFLENFQIFGRFSDFWKIFRFLEDFKNFGRFWEDFQILGRFSDFGKIFRFLKDFQIFGRFSDFWKIFRFLDNPRTWDTDYNSDNWKPEFMTIFVICRLWRVPAT